MSTPWPGQLGLSFKELDLAEALVAQRTPQGPYECSLLASISKWKAEHWASLASHLLPSSEASKEVYEYLEAWLEAGFAALLDDDGS